MEKWSSCHESARLGSKSLDRPRPKEHHNVEYRHSCIADIILKIVGRQILAMQSVDNTQSSSEYLLLSLLGACTY